MTITRRQFIQSAAAAAVLPLVHPDAGAAHVSQPAPAAPLAREPCRLVLDDDMMLVDPNVSEEPPTVTWRQALEKLRGFGDLDEDDQERALSEFEIGRDRLDQEAPWWIAAEVEEPCETPSGVAYELLRGVDFGDLSDAVRVIHCDAPGSNFVGVELQDVEAIDQLNALFRKRGLNVVIDAGEPTAQQQPDEGMKERWRRYVASRSRAAS